MTIGITFDLREDYLRMGYSEEETAEFDSIETIEGIEGALERLGYETERIGNIMQLTRRLADGERWDLVFNICEGMHGTGREAQVPALLDAFEIPYVFSGPLVLALTLDKGLTKRVIRDAGIPTAPFKVISSPGQLKQVNLPYPLFVKPVSEGTGKGITPRSVVRTPEELHEQTRHLLERYHQPVLVEVYLPGREFTVGITGTGQDASVTGVMEVILNEKAEAGVYSYINKEDWRNRVSYAPATGFEATECEIIALEAWKILGAEDGGRIDIRMDSRGAPQFIEINPLAGLHPTHSDLPMLSEMYGIPYDELISRIMKSALKKVRKA